MFDTFMRFYIMTTNGIRNAAQPRDETGATAVEYGLLVALIAGVIVLSVTALGGKVKGAFDGVSF